MDQYFRGEINYFVDSIFKKSNKLEIIVSIHLFHHATAFTFDVPAIVVSQPYKGNILHRKSNCIYKKARERRKYKISRIQFSPQPKFFHTKSREKYKTIVFETHGNRIPIGNETARS